MGYTFPVPLADFFDGLPIQTVTFDLGEALQYSETGAGEILTADIGNRLWRIDVVFKPMYYAQAEQVKAQLNVLRRAGTSLLAHAMPLAYPQYDPDGSIIAAGSPILLAVSNGNRDIRLAGLPIGYTITKGDMLAFTYGSSPTRYALHQATQTVVADFANQTSAFEVSPPIRTGYSLSAPVDLTKPQVKCVVVPGSFNPGESSGRFTRDMSVSFMQTLR